jgi:hypothetical protein
LTIQDVENRLWDSADELRANSGLKESEYSIPVLGLIFLKYADSRFSQVEAELAGKSSGRRRVGKTDYQARGVMYLPPDARFATLLELEEGKDPLRDQPAASPGANSDSRKAGQNPKTDLFAVRVKTDPSVIIARRWWPWGRRAIPADRRNGVGGVLRFHAAGCGTADDLPGAYAWTVLDFGRATTKRRHDERT